MTCLTAVGEHDFNLCFSDPKEGCSFPSALPGLRGEGQGRLPQTRGPRPRSVP